MLCLVLRFTIFHTWTQRIWATAETFRCLNPHTEQHIPQDKGYFASIRRIGNTLDCQKDSRVLETKLNHIESGLLTQKLDKTSTLLVQHLKSAKPPCFMLVMFISFCFNTYWNHMTSIVFYCQLLNSWQVNGQDFVLATWPASAEATEPRDNPGRSLGLICAP
jgi:hypothetical protein